MSGAALENRRQGKAYSDRTANEKRRLRPGDCVAKSKLADVPVGEGLGKPVDPTRGLVHRATDAGDWLCNSEAALSTARANRRIATTPRAFCASPVLFSSWPTSCANWAACSPTASVAVYAVSFRPVAIAGPKSRA